MNRKAKFNMAMPIPQKLNRAEEIVNAMTGNANFPTPTPDLALVQTAIDNLRAAYQKGLDKSLTAKAEQRTRNDELTELLRPLRDYVNEVAIGDEDIVLSSGFEASKLPQPIGNMPQVVLRSGKGGDGDGSVALRWTAVYGAKNYVVERSRDGITYTAIAFPTKATYTDKGLIIGEFFHYRVAANGAAGLGAYSDSWKVLVS